MTLYLTELRRIASDLNRLNAKWCLVGGLASSVYAEPRTTKDIDIALAVATEQELSELREQLLRCGYCKPAILMHTFPTRRMGWRLFLQKSTNEGNMIPIPIDLLTSACGIEDEIVAKAVKIELLPELIMPVAAMGHLIAMKVLSHNDSDRIQDRVDVVSLIEVASAEDLSLAKEALKQIAIRLKITERNLLQELEDLAKI